MTPLHISPVSIMKVLGICALSIGTGYYSTELVGRESLPGRLWWRYHDHLARRLRSLFLPPVAARIVMGQVGALVLVLAVAATLAPPYWWAGIPLALFAPPFWLERERRRRVEQLELQVDGFILALANGLKTVPSPGAALGAVVPILRDPMRQEIDLALKEMRVGATLDQALHNMAARSGSRTLDTGLSAVLIGIQVGGSLPEVLETTASTIREMARLESVVRTKTAEGRAQLVVLMAFPFAMAYLFNLANPGYFDILQQTFAGYVILTLVGLFWIAAVVVARKVLTVDI